MKAMRNCEEYRNMIDAYADDALSRMERMEVEAHCEECPACAAFLEETVRLFSLPAYYPMPRSVENDVMAKVHEASSAEEDAFADEKKRRARLADLEKKRSLRTWGAIAAVLVLALGGWLVTRLGAMRRPVVPAASVSTPTAYEEAQGKQSDPGIRQDTPADLLAACVRYSSAVNIRFGARRTGLSQQTYKDRLADFIRTQKTEPASDQSLSSLGEIECEPALDAPLIITSSYTLLWGEGEDAVEFLCEKEELITLLAELGL